MLDETRLLRLINSYFDQELDPETKRELEAMLLGSARAREIFLERSDWHGLTREWALRVQADEWLDDSPRSRKILPFRRLVGGGLGIAACLALVATLQPFKRPAPPMQSTTAPSAIAAAENVALLAQAVNVEWENGHQYSVGEALPKGWLKIRQGTVRVDFYSGARVFLEGPAVLDLLSQNLARLEKGKLTAHVPPPAEGFTVVNGSISVVDRGTDFGMTVNSPEECEVHVFKGEVEFQGDVPVDRKRELLQGDAVSIRNGVWESLNANPSSFTDPQTLIQAATQEANARWASWQIHSEKFREVPDLLVHFDFENLEPNSQLVTNRALAADPSTQGTIIGCEHTLGRWAKKSALGFAKTSDRVRFRTEGTTPSLTLMAWVRVDSLPLDHNALLSMAPGQTGEVHWKLDKSGRLLLGIRATQERTLGAWDRLVSPTVVTERDFGHWMHLATVIDGDHQVMRHFVNGEEVTSGPILQPVPIQLGMANLGNFDSALPAASDEAYVRNFNGRIDEFALLTRALTAEEIRGMQ